MLALLMLAASASACASTSDEGEGGALPGAGSNTPSASEIEAETEVPDPFAGVSFDGRDFRISTSVNAATSTLQSSNYLIEGPEELTGDAASDAAFQRNLDVMEALDINLVFTETNVSYDGVATLIRNYIQSADDVFDLIINDILGSAPLTVEGSFYNALDMDNFDFDQPYWYKNFMSDISMNYNYQYMLAGDFFIDVLRTSHGLLFNKSTYTNVFGNGDEVYEMVLNGEWTYDKMISICEGAYLDTNGNGSADKEDMYGYVAYQAWGPMIPFLISANPGFVERDEQGYPTITVFNERSLALTEYLIKIFTSSTSGTLSVFNDSQPDTISNFTSGLSIFIGDQRLGSLEYAAFRDMEDEISLIPYPKMEESDSYVTSAHDTSEIGLIPITAQPNSLDFISTVIEVLNRETNEGVLPEYYENALKVKYTRDNVSAQMIDIIHDSLGNSFPLAWSGELSQILMQNTFYSAVVGNGDFASKYSSLEKVASTQLEKIIESFEEQKNG